MQKRLESIEGLDVTRAVYERLKEGIVSQNFKPGEQLNVKRLAEDLNTSTTPVAQAIAKLYGERLVMVLPRRGTFVSNPSVDDIRQLSEAREAIEVYSARLAARKIRKADLDGLQQILDEWKHILQSLTANETKHNAVTLDVRDSQFHCRIVEVAGNVCLLLAYHTIDSQVRAFVGVRFGLYYREIERVSGEGHDRIMQALCEKSEEAAAEAVKAHIWQVYALYAEMFGGDQRGDSPYANSE